MASRCSGLLAVFLLGAASPPGGAGESLETVQARMVEAMGGEAAWGRVPALRLTGVRNRNGYEMALAAWRSKAGQLRVELTLRGQRQVFLHDGETAWLKGFRDEGFTTLEPGDAWEHLEEAEKFLCWPRPWLRYENVRLDGEEEHEGGVVHRLVLVSPEGGAETWLVGREDGRVREIVETRTGDEGESYEVRSYAFDYRDVGDLVLPHYVEMDHGTSLYSFVIETIEVVPVPPAEHFRPPVAGEEES
jgi:hypothetical protein